MEYHTPHKTVVMKMAGKSAGSLVLELYKALYNMLLSSSLPIIIFRLEVTFFSFSLPNSVISFHFISLLNPSLSQKSQFFHSSLSKVSGQCKSYCLFMQRSPLLECWEINNQPTVQGQEDNSTKEMKQRGV